MFLRQVVLLKLGECSDKKGSLELMLQHESYKNDSIHDALHPASICLHCLHLSAFMPQAPGHSQLHSPKSPISDMYNRPSVSNFEFIIC